MNRTEWEYAKIIGRYHRSGGHIRPLTPPERLAMVIKLRRLKTEFLRRQEERTGS